jgi:hypothetical protein
MAGASRPGEDDDEDDDEDLRCPCASGVGDDAAHRLAQRVHGEGLLQQQSAARDVLQVRRFLLRVAREEERSA